MTSLRAMTDHELGRALTSWPETMLDAVEAEMDRRENQRAEIESDLLDARQYVESGAALGVVQKPSLELPPNPSPAEVAAQTAWDAYMSCHPGPGKRQLLQQYYRAAEVRDAEQE